MTATGRKPLMAGNWKMNLNHLEAIALTQKLAFSLTDKDFAAVEVAVLPPFTDIRSVQTLTDGDRLELVYGAQDISAFDSGAYTCILPVNLGQGAALRLGYELASDHGARYVVTLDADGQNDPAELPSILEPLLEDTADFVIASRVLGEDETTDRFRRAGVTLYAWMINAIAKQQLTDSSNGYRAFRLDVLDDIGPHLVQDQYQTAEVVITASSRGWRIVQQPTLWHPRASGASKKGGNLVFGLNYAKVILTTWARVALGNRTRR